MSESGKLSSRNTELIVSAYQPVLDSAPVCILIYIFLGSQQMVIVEVTVAIMLHQLVPLAPVALIAVPT